MRSTLLGLTIALILSPTAVSLAANAPNAETRSSGRPAWSGGARPASACSSTGVR